MLANGDSILRPIRGDLRPDDVVPWDEAPDSRIARLRAVVTENDVLVSRDDLRAKRWPAAPGVFDVVLVKTRPVHEDNALPHCNPVAGQADDAVDERRPC